MNPLARNDRHTHLIMICDLQWKELLSNDFSSCHDLGWIVDIRRDFQGARPFSFPRLIEINQILPLNCGNSRCGCQPSVYAKISWTCR